MPSAVERRGLLHRGAVRRCLRERGGERQSEQGGDAASGAWISPSGAIRFRNRPRSGLCACHCVNRDEPGAAIDHAIWRAALQGRCGGAGSKSSSSPPGSAGAGSSPRAIPSPSSSTTNRRRARRSRKRASRAGSRPRRSAASATRKGGARAAPAAAIVTVYPLLVTRQAEDWPERGERERALVFGRPRPPTRSRSPSSA